MDFLQIIQIARDPALVIVLTGFGIFISKNYESKDAALARYNGLSGRIKSVEDENVSIKRDFVSKEKLDDVLRPVTDGLIRIEQALKEIWGEIHEKGHRHV